MSIWFTQETAETSGERTKAVLLTKRNKIFSSSRPVFFSLLSLSLLHLLCHSSDTKQTSSNVYPERDTLEEELSALMLTHREMVHGEELCSLAFSKLIQA